ncbi:MAG: site-specific DNA-methyltransferase, partial [Christensenellaceae bacterium]|nr:site-specific DNA-methyltransferase [Christensenellaceae bacterium]
MKKIDSKSLDITQANIEQIKALFPEIVIEGKIDFEQLREILGAHVEESVENYTWNWKGKQNAIRLARLPSAGTLLPCVAESKNWDKTKNLYIEGDNLEVLKLLQSSYLNSIKMIYIDPPYNTGNDFIYEDDFADSLGHYREVTGQVLKSNPETTGRYHTNWLNMMYPRLKLARNLLREDGVIFISIDDNEQANLRKLCDEVFGEYNFISCIIWEKRFTRSNNAKMFASLTEYIIAYRKTDRLSTLKAPRTKKADSIYNNPDNDPRGAWTNVPYVSPVTKAQRPNLCYAIRNPFTNQDVIHPTKAWRYEYD